MIVGKNYILVVVENSSWKFYKDLIIVENMNVVINKINIFLRLRNFLSNILLIVYMKKWKYNIFIFYYD